MRTVWKFPFEIDDLVTLELPAGAKILHVASQISGLACVWVLADPGAAPETRRFRLAGTGHPIDEDPATLKYVGTWLTERGALVWHLFEILESANL